MNDDREDKPIELDKRKQGPRRIVLSDRTRVTLPNRWLSPSAAELYLTCPRKYWFRYIYGETLTPGVWMVRGTCGHWAFYRYNNVLLRSKGRRRLSAGKVFDIFVEDFKKRSAAISMRDWAKAHRSKSDMIDGTEASIKLYVNEMAPRLNVLHSERPFRRNVRGLPVMGVVDLMLGEEEDRLSQAVRDYKFVQPSSDILKPEKAHKSLQLSVYGLVTGVKDSGYIALVCGESKGRIEVIPTKVGHHRREQTRRELVHVAKAIGAGAFPMCAPESKRCSDWDCDFWAKCRGAKPGAQVQP